MFTVDNQEVKIISPGIQNHDSGPDFFNARIKIGDTEWAGNVEMHSMASDWNKHNHQIDNAYDSVILHVVHDADTVILNSQSETIPTLEIRGLYSESLFFEYRKLISSRDWVPCSGNIKEVSDLIIFSWLDRVLIERLERKTKFIEDILADTKNNWDEVFYISLCRSFGFNTNSQPFEQLARSLPLFILNKHKDNLFQIEALLFGHAGLLNPRLKDEYSQLLLKEYEFLAKKYDLKSVKSWSWKFMRMRPINFPTIRMAQLAQLIVNSGHLLSKVLEISKLDKMQKLFDIEVSEYWLTHYSFGSESKKKGKSFGSDAFDLILINTIIPFLFVYGKHLGNQQIIDRTLFFLQQTKPESNGVVRSWAADGLKALNAGHSQSLLTLKNEYCNQIRCLECAIGNSILQKNI
jgi:hypothetical protein